MFSLFSKRKPEPAVPIRLFNTATLTVEEFVPIRPGRVGIYNCGPTVYDYQHLGNLRPYILADVLRRTFETANYRVTQVINLTDVGHLTSDADQGEDKLEKSAREKGEKVSDIVERVTNAYYEDLDRLNIARQKIRFVKATDHIEEQIAMVQALEEKGYTYKTSDGIYFDTARFPSYGSLGNVNLTGLKEGARVEENPEKRNPTDFALWKFSPKNTQRQQEWNSPWGVGFPGWHLECSAMSIRYLGKHFDLHTGGIDHIPIHHNNEIAQSEAATGKKFVNYWLHGAFITIEGKKISKSIGNVVYLRHLIERGLSPLAYRLWLLGGHYRTPMNFTWEAVEAAQTALVRLHRYFVEELPVTRGSLLTSYQKRFIERIHDDLDTPGALALLWELVKDTSVADPDKRATLLEFDRVLGLGLRESGRKLLNMIMGKEHRLSTDEVPEDIQALVTARKTARDIKNFQESDLIRDELLRRGWLVEDTPEGQKLHRK